MSKNRRQVALEETDPADLVAELRVLADLVHGATQLVDIAARIPSTAWEQWARRARAALKHEIVDNARKIP